MSEINEKKKPLNKNNKVPKLRFKEFDEEWTICNFYDHFNTFSTNSLSWDQLNYEAGNIKNLHYGIIHSNSKNIVGSDQLPFINNGFVPKRYTLVENGDLILADTSEDRIDSAKGIEISNPNNYKIVSGLHTLHLREKKKITVDGYKAYYVASESFRHFARKYCEGIKVFSIKPSLLKFAHFAYPSNKMEQTKIVDFLNKVVVKQDLLQKKIDILKKYKKGLQKSIFCSNRNDKFELLKNSVIFEPKSDISAGNSIDDGKYVLYKSGQKNGTLNTYTNEGIYIIANDGGEASFKLTNGRFSYTDHCICFKCESDEKTITLANYLQLLEKKITYIGFIGTGLKNIDRQYLGMIKIPVLEYKKIAKSFCEIDKAILNKEYKLGCLLKLKKQLLQSMFI